MTTYPIHECFHTWQGEGVHIGRPAFFIRTFGCPVKCPWCDSAGTWHPDFTPEVVGKHTAADLAGMAVIRHAEIAVITGGEPTIYDLTELTRELKAKGLATHLETSGAFEILGEFDWITVSPKWQKLPLEVNVQEADEIKLIVEDESSIDRWWGKIKDYVRTSHVWLHPEWSQRSNSSLLSSISAAVKSGKGPFRAGYQLHKIYHVDGEDPGSQPPAPLGGNPKLGF